jgi:hypothetical protein
MGAQRSLRETERYPKDGSIWNLSAGKDQPDKEGRYMCKDCEERDPKHIPGNKRSSEGWPSSSPVISVGAMLPYHRRHLAGSGDIFCCHNWWGVCAAGQRVCRGQPQWRTTQLQMLIVPRLRNPRLVWREDSVHTKPCSAKEFEL